METSNRRRYTKKQRAAAVADVPALGVNEAAKKHGVPQTCVSRWAAAAGVRRETAPALASVRKPKAKAITPCVCLWSRMKCLPTIMRARFTSRSARKS